MPHTTYHTPHTTHCTPHTSHCTSHITHHTSHNPHHTSHTTHHPHCTPRLTHCMPGIKYCTPHMLFCARTRLAARYAHSNIWLVVSPSVWHLCCVPCSVQYLHVSCSVHVSMWTKPIVKNGPAKLHIPGIATKTAENSCFGAPGRPVRPQIGQNHKF